jgi:hypothetical protein
MITKAKSDAAIAMRSGIDDPTRQITEGIKLPRRLEHPHHVCEKIHKAINLTIRSAIEEALSGENKTQRALKQGIEIVLGDYRDLPFDPSITQRILTGLKTLEEDKITEVEIRRLIKGPVSDSLRLEISSQKVTAQREIVIGLQTARATPEALVKALTASLVGPQTRATLKGAARQELPDGLSHKAIDSVCDGLIRVNKAQLGRNLDEIIRAEEALLAELRKEQTELQTRVESLIDGLSRTLKVIFDRSSTQT